MIFGAAIMALVAVCSFTLRETAYLEMEEVDTGVAPVGEAVRSLS
ncbi:hypothetical protein SAMN05216189_101966 [Pseudomonas delhiensis]|uniref:Uncharacterized protein n=1 Tax=Pseudomonas delhiensis TaxID=366289 RepID=A0A239I452_9PSED|nr:hypothetical protein SAMN05216189_101966 [Pseudomonas delhiensis]SNS88666.1 hypothetical protein SAMN06295949_10953 [Pseudomonas delhiensis]